MTKIIETPYAKSTKHISSYHHGCKIKNIKMNVLY